ncbi:unnamed protein product [Lupinus luteus]|uniref:ZF-HD dimerization-type domain-containing protein n=1 Tax=Lupinus luteus TaxID=3873 RepID=A0AAV1Y060_LUPLU
MKFPLLYKKIRNYIFTSHSQIPNKNNYLENGRNGEGHGVFVQNKETCIKFLPPPPENKSKGNSTPKTKTSATTQNAIITAAPSQNDAPTLGSGEEGTTEVAICVVCNCHRNFHRQEISNGVCATTTTTTSWCWLPQPRGGSFTGVPPQPFAFTTAYDGGSNLDEKDISNPGGSGGSGRAKKRFRTKFSKEQKDKMLAFAEKIGWRIQKHDGALWINYVLKMV